jgi:hypothetical protein
MRPREDGACQWPRHRLRVRHVAGISYEQNDEEEAGYGPRSRRRLRRDPRFASRDLLTRDSIGRERMRGSRVAASVA